MYICVYIRCVSSPRRGVLLTIKFTTESCHTDGIFDHDPRSTIPKKVLQLVTFFLLVNVSSATCVDVCIYNFLFQCYTFFHFSTKRSINSVHNFSNSSVWFSFACSCFLLVVHNNAKRTPKHVSFITLVVLLLPTKKTKPQNGLHGNCPYNVT